MAQEPEDKQVQDADTADNVTAEQVLDDGIEVESTTTNDTEEVTEETNGDTAQADSEESSEEKVDGTAALQTQINTLEDRLLRSQAEIQNIQQRNAREKAALLQYDGQKLATAILPAIDNLERALAVEADDDIAQQIKTGVELTLKTLQSALSEHGIQAVGEVGEAFDPNQHQAIQTVPADDAHPADTIANVLQKGYVLHDRVLRPAMVAVAQ